jgi:hypothetical protein
MVSNPLDFIEGHTRRGAKGLLWAEGYTKGLGLTGLELSFVFDGVGYQEGLLKS